jgi:hypothetical protein
MIEEAESAGAPTSQGRSWSLNGTTASESIFRDDLDQHRFLDALGEACQRMDGGSKPGC